jgi:RNA polymerase sigma-70 factor (ECF subfamily)
MDVRTDDRKPMHAAPTTLDQTEFSRLTEPFRTELLAHCYRMMGSVHEAEDLAQETYLRAWRSYHAFEGRASMRTYLYRIATNACLTALERRSRRIMPVGRGPQDREPDWLEPMPDVLLSDATDPASLADMRAGTRLAFIAALQHLTPLRRAVLVLRDVLAMPAADVADVLDTTTTAVNSALPRARAQIADAAPVMDDLAEPSELHRRAILDRYTDAFEDADIAALAELLRADVTLEMPPLAQWFHGRTAVTRFFGTRVLNRPGRFRMVPTAANGQPAAVAYWRRDDQVCRPHAVHVLTPDTTGIAHIAVFLDPAVCTRFANALTQ